MQIDFHHGATYVIARYAGFAHRDAEIIAHCAQYVDDATNGGTIGFDNGAMYARISSAHKMLDYRNFEKLANHHVWIPFHFLPGNGGMRSGTNPEGSFIDKIVCRPDSHVARDMVRACIVEQDTAYGLHRLGITMHVYADTWAHQGFAGVQHEVNRLSEIAEHGRAPADVADRLQDYFGGLFDRASSALVGDALPLGHGAALSFPDRPYLRWSYVDHRGNRIQRDNTADFTTAAGKMCKTMQRYRVRDPDADVPGLNAGQELKIHDMLAGTLQEDGEERHAAWLAAIHSGDFGFPAPRLKFRAKGTGSWKYHAIGTRKSTDKRSDTFRYDPSFLASDWKLFHDALQVHRLTVIRDILPRYGISAA